jgi:putative transposase
MPGAYFVTVCVHGRHRLFGKVADGAMLRNQAGEVVYSTWASMPQRFSTIRLDAFVVMPNHFHAIIVLGVADATPLGDIVGAFKSLTTNAYICGVRESGWAPFDQRLWQRNYYEYVIRDDAGLTRIRDYIQMNQASWEADQLHPHAAPNRFVNR